MCTPISYSEKANHQIKHLIFDRADKATTQTEKARLPAYLALAANSITYLVLRSLSIAEMTVYGFRFICSPGQRMLGKSILKQVPLQILNVTLGLPISVIAKAIFIIYEPKYYILDNVEQVKIDIKHAESNTIDSEDYEYESQMASGRAKTRLKEWQKSVRELRATKICMK